MYYSCLSVFSFERTSLCCLIALPGFTVRWVVSQLAISEHCVCGCLWRPLQISPHLNTATPKHCDIHRLLTVFLSFMVHVILALFLYINTSPNGLLLGLCADYVPELTSFSIAEPCQYSVAEDQGAIWSAFLFSSDQNLQRWSPWGSSFFLVICNFWVLIFVPSTSYCIYSLFLPCVVWICFVLVSGAWQFSLLPKTMILNDPEDHLL